MWMMGYNEHGGEVNHHDSSTSFNGTSHRRLRPLIPRPLPNSSSNPPFFSQYQQHLGNLGEQSKREFNNNSSGTTNNMNNGGGAPQVMVSSRWNPTAEQLRALEELYRRGTRTPSAEQIQQITAQLRRYGKIEGKNVFYWFQNHKARERQKRRRQMESGSPPKQHGSSRSVFEVEQTKIWPPSSNCSTSLPQESHVSIQRAVSENNNNNSNNNKVTEAESSAMQAGTRGTIQLGELELQNRWNINNMSGFVERNATWHTHSHLLTNLINTPTSTTNSTITTTTTTTKNNNNNDINNNTNIINITTNNNNTKKTQQDYLSIFINNDHDIVINSCDTSQIIEDHHDYNDHDDDYDDYGLENTNSNISEESQTLQLFPLRSGGCDFLTDKESVSGANPSAPFQFFEFLPLKN